MRLFCRQRTWKIIIPVTIKYFFCTKKEKRLNWQLRENHMNCLSTYKPYGQYHTWHHIQNFQHRRYQTVSSHLCHAPWVETRGIRAQAYVFMYTTKWAKVSQYLSLQPFSSIKSWILECILANSLVAQVHVNSSFGMLTHGIKYVLLPRLLQACTYIRKKWVSLLKFLHCIPFALTFSSGVLKNST